MRARLARAAFEIIAERGISSLRTAAVVERIGVSQGALLHHFANKEELMLAAVDHALAAETERSLAVVAKAGGLPRDRLIAMLIDDFREFFVHGCFWAALDTTMDSGKDRALQSRVTEIVGGHRQPVYAAWIALLGKVGFTESDAQEVVTLTAALVSGLAMRSLWQDVSGLINQSMAQWAEIIESKWPPKT
jgi:AcrR family transcriptional regulator